MKDIVFESADVVKKALECNFSRMYKTTNNTVIEFMQLSENYTFFVIIGKTKRILRVYRPLYHSFEDLQSETFWINKLKKDTQLTIPKVVSGLDGNMIQTFKSVSGEITYYCSMFTYLDGTLAAKLELKGNELMKKMISVGQISASLHNYVIKNDFHIPRFQWDFESMFGHDAVWGDWCKCSVLSKNDIERIETALCIIERRLKKYGKGFDRYGLIHGDIRFNNIIIKGNKLQIIDFDDCGYSWFLYDLACSVMEFNEHIDEMIDAWLTGYQGIRKLSPEEIAEIPTFILMRRILRYAWISSRADTQTAKNIDIKTFHKKTLQLAEKYIEDNLEV